MGLYVILFVAGVLTILLPCILPLVPIVLGASIADRNKLRPLVITSGMVISFVGFTFLLVQVLTNFVAAADYIRISTYYVLLLFGLGFLSHRREVQFFGAILGAVFFWDRGGEIAVVVAAVIGVFCMYIGGSVATWLQRLGSKTQETVRNEFGQESLFSAAAIGLTLGLVWVPCAGPALGFAFALVREQPGLQAFFALTAYGLGSALPLLIVGYGGQYAAHSVRSLTKYTGRIKQVSGVILILSALSLQYGWLRSLETWLVQNTTYGTLGTRIEESLFNNKIDELRSADQEQVDVSDVFAPTEEQAESALPVITAAPELVGLGKWFNSDPLTLEELRGKVVLVDFWTYSCINCVRTLPYLADWWEKYQGEPFVIIGVHTPEFVFEKDANNLELAIDRHSITYPVVQDNDYKTWRAFNNRYWPAKYLIDAEGNIRYMHFGEGKYEETQEAIVQLISEIADVSDISTESDVEAKGKMPHTPETYVGARGWSSLGNREDVLSDEVVNYVFPEEFEVHKYYLQGKWQLVDKERQVLRGTEGKIAIKFTGSEANLVLGQEEDSQVRYVTATVQVDDLPPKSFTFSFNNLYNLFKGEYGTHTAVISIRGEGAAAYAFTFEG